jgi:hypothetical protein
MIFQHTEDGWPPECRSDGCTVESPDGRRGLTVGLVPSFKQAKWTRKYNGPSQTWVEYSTVTIFSVPTQIQRMSRSEKAESIKCLGATKSGYERDIHRREGQSKEKK